MPQLPGVLVGARHRLAANRAAATQSVSGDMDTDTGHPDEGDEGNDGVDFAPKSIQTDQSISSDEHAVVTRVPSSQVGKRVRVRPSVASTRKPGSYKPRAKRRMKPLAPGVAAAAARADALAVRTKLPPFGISRFDTFEEFDEAWADYCVRNFTSYRVRHSLSRESKNTKLAEAHHAKRKVYEAAGKVFSEELHLIPPQLTYYVKSAWCTHGCTQEARGEGERFQAATRYTGCNARLTAQATRDWETGTWYVDINKEIHEHNHTCDASVFESYLNSSEIDDSILFKEAASMVESHGNTKLVCDILSRRLNTSFSRIQLENFKQYRLGGGHAVESMRSLVDGFLAFDGARCLVINDADNIVCGVVLQTGMQRAMFQRWGDSLIMDWTHNTNNLGFYLGSLLVTTANGTGVSVFDFLCVSQSKDMMRAVLNHFISTNTGAREKIQSFVIDKDYTEWAVLVELFTSTDVVLCQFHVLKWFQFVVTAPKYGISVALRGEVVKILRAMVYAVSDDDFKHQQLVLSSVLAGPRYALFHAYMASRWYNITEMWSYAGRGKIFTAANTTSNRLESYWHQYKSTLAKKQRIDLCVQAVFIHGTTVLRREKAMLAQFEQRTFLHPDVDAFIWPVLVEISLYAANLVKGQWNKYVARSASYTQVRSDGSKHVVCVMGVRAVEATVDSATWACSCHFHLGSGLPCRHVMFVAREVCGERVAPIAMIPRRWLMSSAVTLLGDLTTAIDELATLRLSSLETDMPPLSLETESGVAPLPPSSSTRRAVAHVTLRRNEMSDQVVLNDLQKRNYARSLFDNTVAYMMAQGTLRFKEIADDLEATLVEKLAAWRGLVPSAAPDEGHPTRDIDEQELNAEFAEQELLSTFEQMSVGETAERVYEEDLVGANVLTTAAVSIVAGTNRSPMGATLSRLLTGSPGGDSLDAVIGQTIQDAVVYSLIGESTGGPSSDSPQPRVSPLDDLLRACESIGDELSLFGPPVADAAFSAPSSSTTSTTSVQTLASRPTTVDEGEATPSRNTRGAVKRRAAASADVEVKRRANQEDDGVKLSHFTFPTVVRKGVTRQTKQVVSVTGRLAPVNQNSDCPIKLGDCVNALKYSCLEDAVRLHSQYPVLFDDQGLKNRSAVVKRYTIDQALFDVNFAVPSRIVQALKTGIDLRRQDDTGSLDDTTICATIDSPAKVLTTKEQYVATIATKTRGFSEETVRDLFEFHEIGSTLDEYVKDKQWVVIPSLWPHSKPSDAVAFLQGEADQVEGVIDTTSTVEMRKLITQFMATCSLKSTLSLPAQADQDDHSKHQRVLSVEVGSLFGRVARQAKLSDVAVNYGLNLIASQFKDVVVIDSLMEGKFILPTQRLRSTRVVLFPIHFGTKGVGSSGHWCIACVTFDWQGKNACFLYDPLASPVWTKRLAETWTKWCHPLLHAWYARDVKVGSDIVDLISEAAAVDVLKPIEVETINTPTQPDSTSCGLLCIAQGYNYITERFGMQAFHQLSADQVKTMRLRLLWFVLCKSRLTESPERIQAAADVMRTFTRYFTSDVQVKKRSRKAQSQE